MKYPNNVANLRCEREFLYPGETRNPGLFRVFCSFSQVPFCLQAVCSVVCKLVLRRGFRTETALWSNYPFSCPDAKASYWDMYFSSRPQGSWSYILSTTSDRFFCLVDFVSKVCYVETGYRLDASQERLCEEYFKAHLI